MKRGRKPAAFKTSYQQEVERQQEAAYRKDMLNRRYKVINTVTRSVYLGLEDIDIEHCLFTQDPPVRPLAEMEVGDSSKLASDDGLLLVRTA